MTIKPTNRRRYNRYLTSCGSEPQGANSSCLTDLRLDVSTTSSRIDPLLDREMSDLRGRGESLAMVVGS